MSKQDRQGARTPADLERKYKFRKTFDRTERTAQSQAEQINATAFNLEAVTARLAELEWILDELCIKAEVSGEAISLTDSSDCRLKNLILYGNAAEVTSIKVSIGTSDPEDQVQEITLSVPAGLRGVKVDSGGIYTDSNGQQWISDEINLGERVHIQRVGVDESGAHYALDEPVEAPLSAEAFSALHTNKLDTVIQNDAGLWMTVEYIADTKTYIDNMKG